MLCRVDYKQRLCRWFCFFSQEMAVKQNLHHIFSENTVNVLTSDRKQVVVTGLKAAMLHFHRKH